MNIKSTNILIIPLVILTALSNSCAPIEPSNQRQSGLTKANTSNSKPTMVRLNGETNGEQILTLRWNGTIPSLKRDDTWLKGSEVETNVFRFEEDKYYQLVIHFPHLAYIEDGFDGGPLDTITGTISILR